MEQLRSRPACSLAALLAATALGGCSFALDPSETIGTFSGGGRTIEYASPRVVGGPGSGPIPRLFAGQCLLEEFEAAALAALAPVLINFAVDTLGKVLQRAGEDRAVAVYDGLPYRVGTGGVQLATGTTVVGGSGGNQGGEASGLPDCVQFVVGPFDGEEAKPDASFLKAIAQDLGKSPANLRTSLHNAGIYVDGKPAVFIEAAVVASEAGVYHLRPTILYYDRSIDTGTSEITRGLFLEFGINAAPNMMTSKDASKGFIPIGNVTAGETELVFKGKDPRTPRSLWVAAAVPPGKGTKAFNIEVRLVEVRDARPILAAIGDLLVGAEGDKIAEGIRKDLFPTDAERDAAAASRITALDSYSKAIKAYRAAVDARKEALDKAANLPADEQAAIRREQDALVDAALQAVRLAASRAGISSAL